MENSKRIHSQDDASETICLLPAVGARTQEASKSKPDILMTTEEMHKCRPVKESAYLKEYKTLLSYQTAATVRMVSANTYV